MIALVSARAYWSAVIGGLLLLVLLCVAARRWPAGWRDVVARFIGAALLADVITYSAGLAIARTWSATTSLPLALCNAGVVVAGVACWYPRPLLVEVTYFLGLAGALQAVITPDLTVGFPHLSFFEFVVGHLGIVYAALFLVVGTRCYPRSGAVMRVFLIGATYTGLVGVVDALFGANYMFLRKPPGVWTLLSVLGPWPWYVVSAAGVALVLFALLDLPFNLARRQKHHAVTRPHQPAT